MIKNTLLLHITDALGRRRTLARGADAFVRFADGQSWLVCGLGPYADAVGCLPPDAEVYWCECPTVIVAWDRLMPGWRARIPAHWREIAPEDAPEYARDRGVLFYRQGLHIAPDFWGPLLGRVRVVLLRRVPTPTATGTTLVCLPGSEKDLLHQELAHAFAETGCTVWSAPAHTTHTEHTDLHSLLREALPSLFFSTNLRGLDADGQTFHLLRALHVPVALWFVDNPWHILASLRLPWWKAAHIFVTDASFIPGLHAAGAERVHHLPLAFCPNMCAAMAHPKLHSPIRPTLSVLPVPPILFVGRSAFPDKARFFAATKVSTELEREAFALVDNDKRPHFHWWTERLAPQLWPGHAVRATGLGAERCAERLRARWLSAALGVGVHIYGDTDNWRALLPDAPHDIFHDPVDYYNSLPALYAAAPYTLNVTSLLLPAGLTQRHFDVWAAGGFLLTDTTPGLTIFPQELVCEVALARASDLPGAIQRFENTPVLRHDIMQAWREHILTEHTYAKRAATVWEAVGK